MWPPVRLLVLLLLVSCLHPGCGLMGATLLSQKGLQCYQCVGFNKSAPSHQTLNNPHCPQANFEAAWVSVVTNPLPQPLCYVVMLHTGDGQVLTERGALTTPLAPRPHTTFTDAHTCISHHCNPAAISRGASFTLLLAALLASHVL